MARCHLHEGKARDEARTLFPNDISRAESFISIVVTKYIAYIYVCFVVLQFLQLFFILLLTLPSFSSQIQCWRFSGHSAGEWTSNSPLVQQPTGSGAGHPTRHHWPLEPHRLAQIWTSAKWLCVRGGNSLWLLWVSFLSCCLPGFHQIRVACDDTNSENRVVVS